MHVGKKNKGIMMCKIGKKANVKYVKIFFFFFFSPKPGEKPTVVTSQSASVYCRRSVKCIKRENLL